MTNQEITKEEATAALQAAAFRETAEAEDEPDRYLVHCQVGFLGADWDLADALELVARADQVAWVEGIAGHDLGVLADETAHYFAVRRPVPAESGSKTEHLKVSTSDRGFDHMPAIRGEYGDEWLHVYESSAAEGPHVWLRVREDQPIHLTAENAWKLADQLRYLVEHHYQGDARPEAGD